MTASGLHPMPTAVYHDLMEERMTQQSRRNTRLAIEILVLALGSCCIWITSWALGFFSWLSSATLAAGIFEQVAFLLAICLVAILIFSVRRYRDLRLEMTRRREAEALMQDRDLLFRRYFELGPIGKGISAPDKTWVEINDHLCAMFGYSRDELMQKTWADLTWPDDLAKDVAHFESMMQGQSEGYIMDKRFLRSDGSVLYANMAVSCIRSPEGEVNHIIATFLDVSERKRAESQVRALSQALLQSQERERQRISRDLHDNVAQDLSSLKMSLETLLADSPEATAGGQRLPGIIRVLQTTINNVRDISYNLRPPGLEQLGLIRTLAQFCDDYTRTHGIETDFDSAGLDFAVLDEETEINLYRILQEALSNVRKHAHATKVVIRLVASWPSIILRINDNGCGFDTGTMLAGGEDGDRHMGLSNMRERVTLLGGSFAIEKGASGGTRIRIEIPQRGNDHV